MAMGGLFHGPVVEALKQRAEIPARLECSVGLAAAGQPGNAKRRARDLFELGISTLVYQGFTGGVYGDFGFDQPKQIVI